MKKLILIILMVISFGAWAAEEPAVGENYFHQREQGWFWYKDPVIEEKVEPKEEPVKKDSGSSDSATAREQLRKMGENLEEAQAVAMLNPTKENITEYMRQMQIVTEMSQNLATRFKQTLWVTPDYDYSLQRPLQSQAIMLDNIKKNNEEGQILSDIAKDKALLFFFRSDCPYCHAMSPLLKKLINEYGFTPIAVSMDGGPLPDFQDPKINQDLAKKLNVTTVPAIYLVDPRKNQVSSVGYGFQDWSLLKAKVIFAASQFDTQDKMKTGSTLSGIMIK